MDTEMKSLDELIKRDKKLGKMAPVRGGRAAGAPLAGRGRGRLFRGGSATRPVPRQQTQNQINKKAQRQQQTQPAQPTQPQRSQAQTQQRQGRRPNQPPARQPLVQSQQPSQSRKQTLSSLRNQRRQSGSARQRVAQQNLPVPGKGPAKKVSRPASNSVQLVPGGRMPLPPVQAN